MVPPSTARLGYHWHLGPCPVAEAGKRRTNLSSVADLSSVAATLTAHPRCVGSSKREQDAVLKGNIAFPCSACNVASLLLWDQQNAKCLDERTIIACKKYPQPVKAKAAACGTCSEPFASELGGEYGCLPFEKLALHPSTAQP